MPSGDSPEVIVARWLQANQYRKTLSSFLDEAGLPEDAGLATNGALTLERVLEEKQLYDQSLLYEKRSEPTQQGWSQPAPTSFQILEIPQPSNILHVSVDNVIQDKNPASLLSVTMADRRLMQAPATGPMEDVEHILTQDSPILSWMPVLPSLSRQYIGTTMSGKVFVHTQDGSIPLLGRADHKRYCVKAALNTTTSGNSSIWLLATIGWDSVLNLYTITPTHDPSSSPTDPATIISSLPAPSSSLTLPSIPEDILWLQHPATQSPILLLTRRDSCLLHYFSPTTPAPTLLGTQNLAPHAISWTIFTPSSIALCPSDPTLLAVATSALPHLKLILVHIRIPSTASVSSSSTSSTSTTSAGPASSPSAVLLSDPRSILAKANAEESLIKFHISTLAPQTPYSTPKVVWRPDGSGIWVNGDDGCVRGIEASSGKVIVCLKGGHEVATKVRTLWAGLVEGDEWVVSGGFDRSVVVWRVGAGEECREG